MMPGFALSYVCPASCVVSVCAEQEEHGVAVDIGKSTHSVKIRGRKDAVEAAAAQLQAQLDRFKRENLTVTVDPETVPALIGKGGANIRKLQVRPVCRHYPEPRPLLRAWPAYLPAMTLTLRLCRCRRVASSRVVCRKRRARGGM
jgi:hypothetical protein